MNSLIRNVKSIQIPALQSIARKTTPSLSSLDNSRCSSPEIQFRSRSLPPLDKSYRSFSTFSAPNFVFKDTLSEVKEFKAPTLKILTKFRRSLTQKYIKREVKKPKKNIVRDSKCQEVCIKPLNDKVKKSYAVNGPQRSFHDYRLLESPTSSYHHPSKEFSLMSSNLRNKNQNSRTIKNILNLNEKVKAEKQKKNVIETQCKNKVNYFYLESHDRTDCKQCCSKNKKRMEEFNKKNSTKLHNKTTKQQSRSYATRSSNARFTEYFGKKHSKRNAESSKSSQQKSVIQVQDQNVQKESGNAVTLYNLIKSNTSKKYIPENPINKYKFESKKRPDTYEFDPVSSDVCGNKKSYAPELARKVNPVLMPNSSQNNRLLSVMNRNSSSPFLQRKIASKEVIENFSNVNPSNFGTKGTHSYPVLMKKIAKEELPKKWAPKLSQEKLQLYVEQCKIQELISKKSQAISSPPNVDRKVNIVKSSVSRGTPKEIKQSDEKEVFFIHHKDDLNNKICNALESAPKVELGEHSKEQLAQAIRNMIQPVIQKEVLKYDEVKTALERMEKNLEYCLGKLNLPKSKSAGQISKYDLNWVMKKEEIKDINRNPEIKEPLLEKSKTEDPIRRNPLTAPNNAKVEIFNDPLNERNILTSFADDNISKYDPCNKRDKRKDYLRKRRTTGGDQGGESSGNQNVLSFKNLNQADSTKDNLNNLNKKSKEKSGKNVVSLKKSIQEDAAKENRTYMSEKSKEECRESKNISRDGFPMIESKCNDSRTRSKPKDCSPDIKTNEMCQPKRCKMEVELCEEAPKCATKKVEVVSFEVTEPCCCKPRNPCQGKEDDICPRSCFKVNDPEKKMDYCTGPGCKNSSKGASFGPGRNPQPPKKATPHAGAENVILFDKKKSEKKPDKYDRKRMPCKIEVPEKPCDPCNPPPKKPPCSKKDPCKTAPEEETPLVKLFERENKDHISQPHKADYDVLDFKENHKIDFHGSEALEKNYLFSNNPDRSDCPKKKNKKPSCTNKVKEDEEEPDACVKKPEKKPCKKDPCEGKLKRPKKLTQPSNEQFLVFEEQKSAEETGAPFNYLAPNNPDRSDCPRRKKKIPCREKLKWPKEIEPCGPPPKPPCKEDPCKGKIKRKASEIEAPEHLVLHENKNTEDHYTYLAPNNPDRSDCPRKKKKNPCRERLKWPKEEEPCGPPKKQPCKKDPCKNKKWASENNLDELLLFDTKNKSGSSAEKSCKVEVSQKETVKCSSEPPKPPCGEKDPCKECDGGCQKSCQDNICRKPPCSEDDSRISLKESECNKSKTPFVKTNRFSTHERNDDYCTQFPMPEDCCLKIQPDKVPKAAPPRCLQRACQENETCFAKDESITCAKRIVEHGFEGMNEPCKPDYKKQEPCPECEKECADIPKKHEPIFYERKVDESDVNEQRTQSDPNQTENDKRYCGGNLIGIHNEPKTELPKSQSATNEFVPPIRPSGCNTKATFNGPSKSSWNPVKIDSDKMEDSKTLKSKSKSNIDVSKNSDSVLKSRQKTQGKTIKAAITTPKGSKTMMETVSDLCMLIIRKGKGGKQAAPIVVTLARSEPDFYAYGTPSSGIGLMGSSGSGGGKRGKDPFDIQRASLFGWGKSKRKIDKKKEKYPWSEKDACLSKKHKKPKNDCNKSKQSEEADPYVCVKGKKKEGKDDCKPKEDPCKKKDPCKDLNKAITGSKNDSCKSKDVLGDKARKIIDNKRDSCKDVQPPPKKEDPCKKKEDPCKKKEDDHCKKKEDDHCKKDDPCKKKEVGDFVKKREDPCKPKQDPCKKKEDDVCPKKCMSPTSSSTKKIEDPACSLKSAYQLANDKFRPRSTSFCSGKKEESSSCSDGNKPKKSEPWSHKSDVNVCFKTPAQIVDATPISKCVRMEVIDFKTPAQIVDESRKCERIKSDKSKLKNRYPWNGPCKGCLKEKVCLLSEYSEALADEKLCLEKTALKPLTKVVVCPKKQDESSSCKKPDDVCQKTRAEFKMKQSVNSDICRKTREEFKRKKEEQSSVKKCMEYAKNKSKTESCKNTSQATPPSKSCADSKKSPALSCSMVDVPNEVTAHLQTGELSSKGGRINKPDVSKDKVIEEKSSKYIHATDGKIKHVIRGSDASKGEEAKSSSSIKSIEDRKELVKNLFARLELMYAELDRKMKFENEKHSVIPTQPQFKTCDLIFQKAAPLDVRDEATGYDHAIIQFYMDYLKMLGAAKNPIQVPCQSKTSASDIVFEASQANMNVPDSDSPFDQAALEFYIDYLNMLKNSQNINQVPAQAESNAADIVFNTMGALEIKDFDHTINNADIEFYFDYLKMLDKRELAEKSPTQSKTTISKLVSEGGKQTPLEIQSDPKNENSLLESYADYYRMLNTSKTLDQIPVQPKNSASDILTRIYKDKAQLDLTENHLKLQELEDGEGNCCYLTANSMISDHLDAYQQELMTEQRFQEKVYRLPGSQENEMVLEDGDNNTQDKITDNKLVKDEQENENKIFKTSILQESLLNEEELQKTQPLNEKEYEVVNSLKPGPHSNVIEEERYTEGDKLNKSSVDNSTNQPLDEKEYEVVNFLKQGLDANVIKEETYKMKVLVQENPNLDKSANELDNQLDLSREETSKLKNTNEDKDKVFAKMFRREGPVLKEPVQNKSFKDKVFIPNNDHVSKELVFQTEVYRAQVTANNMLAADNLSYTQPKEMDTILSNAYKKLPFENVSPSENEETIPFMDNMLPKSIDDVLYQFHQNVHEFEEVDIVKTDISREIFDAHTKTQLFSYDLSENIAEISDIQKNLKEADMVKTDMSRDVFDAFTKTQLFSYDLSDNVSDIQKSLDEFLSKSNDQQLQNLSTAEENNHTKELSNVLSSVYHKPSYDISCPDEVKLSKQKETLKGKSFEEISEIFQIQKTLSQFLTEAFKKSEKMSDVKTQNRVEAQPKQGMEKEAMPGESISRQIAHDDKSEDSKKLHERYKESCGKKSGRGQETSPFAKKILEKSSGGAEDPCSGVKKQKMMTSTTNKDCANTRKEPCIPCKHEDYSNRYKMKSDCRPKEDLCASAKKSRDPCKKNGNDKKKEPCIPCKHEDYSNRYTNKKKDDCGVSQTKKKEDPCQKKCEDGQQKKPEVLACKSEKVKTSKSRSSFQTGFRLPRGPANERSNSCENDKCRKAIEFIESRKRPPSSEPLFKTPAQIVDETGGGSNYTELPKSKIPPVLCYKPPPKVSKNFLSMKEKATKARLSAIQSHKPDLCKKDQSLQKICLEGVKAKPGEIGTPAGEEYDLAKAIKDKFKRKPNIKDIIDDYVNKHRPKTAPEQRHEITGSEKEKLNHNLCQETLTLLKQNLRRIKKQNTENCNQRLAQRKIARESKNANTSQFKSQSNLNAAQSSEQRGVNKKSSKSKIETQSTASVQSVNRAGEKISLAKDTNVKPKINAHEDALTESSALKEPKSSYPSDQFVSTHSDVDKKIKNANEYMTKRKSGDLDGSLKKVEDKKKSSDGWSENNEKVENIDMSPKKLIEPQNKIEAKPVDRKPCKSVKVVLADLHERYPKYKPSKDADVKPEKSGDPSKSKINRSDLGLPEVNSENTCQEHSGQSSNVDSLVKNEIIFKENDSMISEKKGCSGAHSAINEELKKVNECIRNTKGKDSNVWPKKIGDKGDERNDSPCGKGSGTNEDITKMKECVNKKNPKDSDVWPKNLSKNSEFVTKNEKPAKSIAANSMLADSHPGDSGGGHSGIEEEMKKVNECMKKRKGKDSDVWPRRIVDKDKERSKGDECPKKCISANTLLVNPQPKNYSCGGGGRSEIDEELKKVDECMKKRKSKDSDVWPKKNVDKDKEKSTENTHQKKRIPANNLLANSRPGDSGGGHSGIEEEMKKVNECMKKRKGKDSDVWPRRIVDKDKERSKGDECPKKCISANTLLVNPQPKNYSCGGGGRSEIDEELKKVDECMKKRKSKDSDVWPKKNVDKDKEKSTENTHQKKRIPANNLLANSRPGDSGGGHSGIEEEMKKVNECMKKRKGKDSDVWPRRIVDKDKERSKGDECPKKCISANTLLAHPQPKNDSCGGGGHSEIDEELKKVNECMKKRKSKDSDVWPKKNVDKDEEKSTENTHQKKGIPANNLLANSRPGDSGGGHSGIEEEMKKVNECMKKRKGKDSDVWPRRIVNKDKEKSTENDCPKKCNPELQRDVQSVNHISNQIYTKSGDVSDNRISELQEHDSSFHLPLEKQSKLVKLCKKVLEKNIESQKLCHQNPNIEKSEPDSRHCYLDSDDSKAKKIISLCDKIKNKDILKHSTKEKVKVTTLARPYGSFNVVTLMKLLGRQANQRQIHNVRYKSTKSDDGCPKEYQVGDTKTLFKCLKNKAKKLSKEDICNPQKKCDKDSAKIEGKESTLSSGVVCDKPKINRTKLICNEKSASEKRSSKCSVSKKREVKKYPTHAEKKEAICKFNCKAKKVTDSCETFAKKEDPCETFAKKEDPCKKMSQTCLDNKPEAVSDICKKIDKTKDLTKNKSDACLKDKPRADFCNDGESKTKSCLNAIKPVDQENSCKDQDAKKVLFKAKVTIDPKKFTTGEVTMKCPIVETPKQEDTCPLENNITSQCLEKCKNKTDYQLGPHSSKDENLCGCPTPNCDCYTEKLLPPSTYRIDKGKDLGIQKSCMKKQKSAEELNEEKERRKMKAKDQGLLRQCAVMSKELSEGKSEKQLLSKQEAAATEGGENIVCKVMRLGAGEKLVCTSNEKLEPKTYLNPSNCQEDSDTSVYEDAEEGVLKVLNCTIVKDEFGNEKLVCKPLKIPEEVMSEADLIKFMKKGTSGERLAKVTSNKLVCREVPLKVNGNDCLNEDGTPKTEMLCQILKVEEIRRENERCDMTTPKIKKRNRKSSFEDLTKRIQMQSSKANDCDNMKGQK